MIATEYIGMGQNKVDSPDVGGDGRMGSLQLMYIR